jgi:hypothetical protein
MTRISSIATGALIAAFITAPSPRASASELSPQWGGSGGGSFALVCPAGSPFMSGVTVRRGSWIDKIAANCSDGAGHNNGTPFTGGSGGSVTEVRTCNNGDVVVGIAPISATYFHGGYLVCNNLNNVRARNTSTEYTLALFGGGGNAQPFYRCPAGNAAIGLYGASGIFVDRAGFICQDVP